MKATFMWRLSSISVRKRPSDRFEIENDADVGRRAHQRHALGDFLAAVHVHRAVRDHADILGQRGVGAQELVLLAFQLRIAPLHLQVLLGVPLHHHDARDAVAVGAHVGDVLRDVDVHARNHGHHRDQRGGGENDAEQREEAAQLAAAQRLDGAPDRLPKRCVDCSYQTQCRSKPGRLQRRFIAAGSARIHSITVSSSQKRGGRRAMNPTCPPCSVARSSTRGLRARLPIRMPRRARSVSSFA